MASTFSNLGLNLQATGENSGTWGAITNVNLQEIDNAIAGVVTVTLTGNTTLAFTTNSSSTTFTDESGRNKTIILSGSLSATTVTITDTAAAAGTNYITFVDALSGNESVEVENRNKELKATIDRRTKL